MPRARTKLDSREFSEEHIKRTLSEKEKKAEDARILFSKIQSEDLSQIGCVSEAIGTAFIKAGNAELVLKALSLVKDAGHLGFEFISLLSKDVFTKDSDTDVNTILDVCLLLLPFVKDIQRLFSFLNPIILLPPVDICDNGHKFLVSNCVTREVTVYTMTEKKNIQSAFIYCRICKESYKPWSVDTHKRKKNNKGSTRTYYNWNEANFVAATEQTLVEKTVCESYSNLLGHGWTSYQAFAEAYTETSRNMSKFSSREDITENDESMWQMDRRVIRKAFYEYEAMLLLSEKGLQKRPLDLKKFVNEIALCSDSASYEHIHTAKCDKSGCKYYASCDGNWKNRYPLCMYQSKVSGPIARVNYPINCINGPLYRKAFCAEHCETMEKLGWPTNLREFVAKIEKNSTKLVDIIAASQEAEVDEANVSEYESEDDDSDLDQTVETATGINKKKRFKKDNSESHYEGPITRKMKKLETLKAATKVQDQLLKNAPEYDDKSKNVQLMRTVNLLENDGNATCNKNIGKLKTIQMWSRGHFMIVAPCGHIYSWKPLYGAESPSQAFLIFLDHLQTTALRDLPADEWHKYTLFYDNMCHIDDMHAARRKLPTELYPYPFNEMFLRINKGIDKLHLSNHKNAQCKTKYDPSKVQEMHPNIEINTMRAEQTFVWLSRFKKILCAMDKDSHHFVLHRLITRRNAYTVWKNHLGKEVTLPKIRNKYST